jgi:hypothetical protein
MSADWILVLVGMALLTFLTAVLTYLVSVGRMPASYRIAVVGFPQSGKTTLITAVFAYLFRRGMRGASIVPRGDETIKRINANMEQLELGKRIGPTTDQDVFAYRAEIVLGGLVRRRYKLEIGDFPGESSRAFTRKHGNWLHETKYFEWAISSDAFLFVIDVGAVLLDESGEYVAGQKRAMRAAWQRLEEHHLDSRAKFARKRLILVFTKADLLLETASDRAKLRELTFEKSPLAVEIESAQSLEGKEEEIKRRFKDLIEYFEHENSKFQLIFASVFVNVEGERFGIPAISRHLVPGSSA